MNQKVFVDGSTHPDGPFVAVIGERYISDYLLWQKLNRPAASVVDDVMGCRGRSWHYAEQKQAEAVVKSLRRYHHIEPMGWQEFEAATSATGRLFQVGPIAVVLAPSFSKATVKRLLSWGCADEGELVSCEAGVIIHWSREDGPVLNSAAVRRLAEQHDQALLKATLRKSGWLVTAEFTDVAGGVIASILIDRGLLSTSVTLAELPAFLDRTASLGCEVITEFDPSNPWPSIKLNTSKIPGWNAPTKSGRELYPYQRDGISFMASRGGRALCLDEMGLGKTAQAIGFANASAVRRAIVIAPAALLNVWHSELIAWDTAEMNQILIVDGQWDLTIPPNCSWVIGSYELIAGRAKVWTSLSSEDHAALLLFLSRTEGLDVGLGKKPLSVRLDRPLQHPEQAPIPLVLKEKWEKLNRDLANPRLTALQEWAADLLILDEVHAAKSAAAKRTSAVITLSRSADFVIGLTGTPLQNATNEGATIVEVINPPEVQELRRQQIGVERCRAMLNPISIRRSKNDVLPELPSLTEQRIDLPGGFVIPETDGWEPGSDLDPGWAHALSPETRDFARLLAPNLTRFVRERKKLGLEKASRSDVIDLISSIVEQSGPTVVFAAHHTVIDKVCFELRTALPGSKIVSADGRQAPDHRAHVVSQFQAGEIACLVAGAEAMGEGITLTRASTAVFLETAWKPKTYEQARSRLHRIGQERPVHVVYLIAPHAVDHILQAMAMHKASIISAVHQEDVRILGQVVSAPSMGPAPESDAIIVLEDEVSDEACSVSDATVDIPEVFGDEIREMNIPFSHVSDGDGDTDWGDVSDVIVSDVTVSNAGGYLLCRAIIASDAANEPQINDHPLARMPGATRQMRYRERHGDVYREKQREYTRQWRARNRGA